LQEIIWIKLKPDWMIWKSSPRRCVYRDYIAIYLVSD